MSSYVSNVYAALLLFPFLAALLAVPYAVYEYRKYGSIPWWKTVLVFTMVFYLLCAYFMVILPLPADRDIYIASVQVPQLVPFSFVADIAAKTTLDPASPRSWIAWLRTPEVYTVLFTSCSQFPLEPTCAICCAVRGGRRSSRDSGSRCYLRSPMEQGYLASMRTLIASSMWMTSSPTPRAPCWGIGATGLL